MIIGICGYIGSGKDTVADYLVNVHGFRRESFAGTLKDAVAAVFGWDRTMLEGRTKASREWREQVDPWWAERLNMPHLTPRWVLQYWGTDVCRHGFHDDIWIASLENKLRQIKDNVVISDVRFPNELKAIKNSSGIMLRTQRGPRPEWVGDAILDLANGSTNMKTKYPNVHFSEWALVNSDIDMPLDNNSTMDHLYGQVDGIVEHYSKNPG